VLIGLAAAGVASVGLTAVVAHFVDGAWWLIPLAYAGFFLASAASYLYTTRRGKFAVWAGLLADLELTGQECVVDLGCGRGAVLTAAAGLVGKGRVVGVDVWRSIDQSGNDPARTLRNAGAEAVSVDLVTADLRALPLATGSVDVVLSSLAIHNITDPAGRSSAIEEVARILRPGGRLVIADLRHATDYADQLTALGLTGVRVRDPGWRMWFGGPWVRTRVVTATR
jgi:SAM-dependent methyltransferase